MKNIILLIVLIILILLIGCKTGNHIPLTDNKHGQAVAEVNNIKDSASIINENSINPVVGVETKKILKSAGIIEKILISYTNEVEELKRKIHEFEDKFNSSLNKITILTISLGSIGFVVSLALFFTGNLKSITLSIILGSLIVSGIFLKFIIANIVWLGPIISLLLVCSLIFYTIKHRKSTKELVKTIEKTKDNNSLDISAFREIANKTQSKYTKEVVDRLQTVIKKERESEGKPTLVQSLLRRRPKTK